MSATTRPEFTHMAAAFRRMATSYDASGRPDIGNDYRGKADLLDGSADWRLALERERFPATAQQIVKDEDARSALDP